LPPSIQFPPLPFQASFLEAFAALQPDLAVTAAYGNMLPQAFLDIPRHGTLNIHPSLLPQYRGAAPVQRAVEVGGWAMASQHPPQPAAPVPGRGARAVRSRGGYVSSVFLRAPNAPALCGVR
jgi:hypothetical protein